MDANSGELLAQTGGGGREMFERHTDKARRAIFFARYEASQLGSPRIEAEHLLLGLLQEDQPLTKHFLQSHESLDSIRRQIEQRAPAREKSKQTARFDNLPFRTARQLVCRRH